MIRWAGLVLCVLSTAGCKDLAWGPYVSPQVTGQVLAADTHEPLAGVRVTRGPPRPHPLAGWHPYGAELLMLPPPTLTDPSGRFVLASERILVPVRWGGWSSVRLTFDREGYLLVQTNYSITSLAATNTPDGMPWLKAGQVLMPKAPAQKRGRSKHDKSG